MVDCIPFCHCICTQPHQSSIPSTLLSSFITQSENISILSSPFYPFLASVVAIFLSSHKLQSNHFTISTSEACCDCLHIHSYILLTSDYSEDTNQVTLRHTVLVLAVTIRGFVGLESVHPVSPYLYTGVLGRHPIFYMLSSVRDFGRNGNSRRNRDSALSRPHVGPVVPHHG